jgi:hypothetical protein
MANTNRFLIVCGGTGNKLLGQRRVLGVNGEVHIDVSNEIKERAEDSRSLVVKLDESVGTLPDLFLDLEKRISPSPADQAGRSLYVETRIMHPSDVEHAKFSVNYWPSSGFLRDGLAQAPAIGGATIRHRGNVSALRSQLAKIATKFAANVGPQNPLDVWIVSSTAGGTGEGIHRFVAATLADTLDKTFVASLKLNFIRVGALTFRSVNAKRTALNTFFGVAADAAFELKFKKDFPGISVNWFYVDLPDTGITSRGTQMRSEIIEMAAKSIMLDELAGDMDKLLSHNRGMRMVVVRTGYWGKDFGESVKYYHTLQELAVKLDELIEPDYKSTFIKGKLPPDFRNTDTLKNVVRQVQDSGDLLKRMVAGWKFPRYRAGGPVGDAKFRELMEEWKQAVHPLTAPREVGSFGIKYTTIETVTVEGQQKTEEMPLQVPAIPAENTYDKNWVRGINDAHRVKAWCAELLEGPEGLKAKLLDLAQACSDAQHGFNPFKGNLDRARDLARSLGNFVVTLEQVNHLMGLQADVERLLDAHLKNPKDLQQLVKKQRDIAKAGQFSTEVSPIKAAELTDELALLTNESWLCLLYRAAQQGRTDIFKREVLRGAVGLTREGLIDVLGDLPSNADVPLIKNELRERMGRMFDADGREWEAQWWQAAAPREISLGYCYRILPYLEPTLQAQLEQHQEEDSNIRYIFTGLGVTGLYALALEGVSLNAFPGPDVTTTPAYLLRPLVPVVRQVLTVSFEIASASVIGEPLYYNAMESAGLERKEIELIGRYYQFYKE